jgi:hypothetical protein
MAYTEKETDQTPETKKTEWILLIDAPCDKCMSTHHLAIPLLPLVQSKSSQLSMASIFILFSPNKNLFATSSLLPDSLQLQICPLLRSTNAPPLPLQSRPPWTHQSLSTKTPNHNRWHRWRNRLSLCNLLLFRRVFDCFEGGYGGASGKGWKGDRIVLRN